MEPAPNSQFDPSRDLIPAAGNVPAALGKGLPAIVQRLTLEQPPSQANGGGLNSSLSAGAITLAAPLAPGASINVEFLLGIQQAGAFRFFVNVEALP